MAFIRHLLDWLFPYNCIGCGRDDQLLCNDCFKEVGIPEKEVCPGCGCLCLLGMACGNCRSSLRLSGLMVGYAYEKGGVLAKILHLFKYEGCRDYGPVLVKLMDRQVSARFQDFLEKKIDLITWVPLSKRKFKSRGFNQSQVLAESLPAVAPRLALLEKTRETKAQMQLDRAGRLVNLKGAFRVSPAHDASLSGQRILVVDDIATTLATLSEVARVLLEAGAAEVYGLVLARQQE